MSSSKAMSNYLTKRTLLEWRENKSGTLCYLGNIDDNLQISVCLDTESNRELLLSFTLPVKFKIHSQSRSRQKTISFVIQADMFDYDIQEASFSVRSLESSNPSESTNLALRRALLAPDPTNPAISCLRFRLRSCGEIFIPKADGSPLIPTSEKASDAIAALRSLSQVREFYAYVVVGEQPLQSLKTLCQKVSDQQMLNNAIDFTTCSDHKAGRVCNDWSNINIDRVVQGSIMPGRTSSSASTVDPLPAATFDVPFDAEQRQGTPPKYNEAVSSSNNDRKHADTQWDACKQTRLDEDAIDIESRKDLNTCPPMYMLKPDLERKREFSNITADHVQYSDKEMPDSSSATSNTSNGQKRVRFAKYVQVQNMPITTAVTCPSTFRNEMVILMQWLHRNHPSWPTKYFSHLAKLGYATSKGDGNLFLSAKFEFIADVLIAEGGNCKPL